MNTRRSEQEISIQNVILKKYSLWLIPLCLLLATSGCIGEKELQPSDFYGTFKITSMKKISNCYIGLSLESAKESLNKNIVMAKNSYINKDGRNIGMDTIEYSIHTDPEPSQFCLKTISATDPNSACTGSELKVLDTQIQKYFSDAPPTLYTIFEIGDRDTLYNEIGCWVYEYKRVK